MPDKINVIIDGRMIDKHLHGIARYTYELIKYGQLSNKINYTVLVNDLDEAKEIFFDIEGLTFIKMKSKFLSIKEQFELPIIINKYNNIIFHSPSFVSSPFINKNMIMTIHDLNHIQFPQFYKFFHKYYYKLIVKFSAKKCKKILTVSNFSKSELVEWLNCTTDHVAVTYNGIGESFKPVMNENIIKTIQSKYGLPPRFILYLGNLKPHKNVGTLLKAINHIKDKEISLVLNGYPTDEIQYLINKIKISDRVKFIGFVDDDDLATLYSSAELFIFPSMYEGFGLPPLEAMACGCPTIVSSSASLPEIVLDGATKFNTFDEKDLAMKINCLIGNVELDNLIKKGINRSKCFTWEKCFNETYEEYYKIWRGR
ncbi:glycosyltransferase family 4 protein [Turicibacter sanguinis]|uniref:glycosyltransferase family 4 protein n=1 Tax=Turicibacter sanguinis TaxID=154288 RepID=UPI0018A90C03|nr:glycosyltransferase family 1 protein [Turicibacter sanguinis]MDB8558554.1 glycosyltransferase family 1 protein [Turicibacter sanguinis]MDB8561350.1 glycosyltransferase family 1 protein [Turicibacter sanguinis]